MLFYVAAATLISAVAASPIASTELPPVKHSGYQGFNIMLNVTDPEHELASVVHKKFLTALHVDAGTNKVGVDQHGLGVTFFRNGTKEERLANRGTLLADLGLPNPIPFGVNIVEDDSSAPYAAHTVWLNAGGHPDTYVNVSPDNHEVVRIEIATADVCMEKLPSGVDAAVLHQYYVGNDPNHIPKECVPVTLIPQCADLRDSPVDHHLFSPFTFCYPDATSIDWTKWEANPA
ncbi:hypothetical protein PWT90_10913 [Aphanocladium album]|nr:hypothetical protein PWT90_10913 [Aphanocladium album]